jgi:rubrerythrin
MNHDDIRREARASQVDHERSMPVLRDAMNRFFDREQRTADETSAAMLGGLTRRNLFRVGGMGIAGAALLAACGSDKAAPAATTAAGTTLPPTTVAGTMAPTTTLAMAGTTAAAAMSGDVVILRTASSIEELAVAAYQIAIDSGLVKTAAVADAAKLFQSQHKEHSQLFQAATTKAGGTPFTMPNPAVLAALKPKIDALKDEAGVLALALMLETAAAQTYQSNVGAVTDLALNKALMSVGGVEARHAAVLAGVLGQPAVPRSFGGADNAIAAGTGV